MTHLTTDKTGEQQQPDKSLREYPNKNATKEMKYLFPKCYSKPQATWLISFIPMEAFWLYGKSIIVLEGYFSALQDNTL